jgi:hypothetical protein
MDYLKVKVCLRIKILLITALFFCGTVMARAADLQPGTVIFAANIDAMISQTFEGKTIGSMLTERIEWMIREKGLTITLRHSEKIPVDPRWIRATKKYSSDVRYDPKTRIISGYKAGLAFPDLDTADPHAADKLMWNVYLTGGWPRDDCNYVPRYASVLIDGKKGIERSMEWMYMRTMMTGRISGEEPVRGDGTIYYKQVMCGLYPYDIKGTGSYTIRYMDGRKDDMWAYMRTVRRTRQLMGGAWMDPISGTDQLNDEISIFSGFPTWYPGFRIIGKRVILAVAHSRGISWDEDNPENPFPNIDLKNPPYWNPLNDWEPREVWVVEATMPDEHPYSRRIYYFDAVTGVGYMAECYDKQGEFFKIILNDSRSYKGDDGETSWGNQPFSGYIIDFRKHHATVFFVSENVRRNPPGLDERNVTIGVMESIAQGQWKPPF